MVNKTNGEVIFEKEMEKKARLLVVAMSHDGKNMRYYLRSFRALSEHGDWIMQVKQKWGYINKIKIDS